MTVDEVKALGARIRGEVAKAITGQDGTVDLLLTALFASGHILLEGPPGTAKTFLARCFARATGLDYGRIQFTPDLMPGDIIGANLFNFQNSTFTLTKGPIFTELLLADEINRTPPKTQAALLEAMQERSVTFDGTTHMLSPRFMVVATQNPIEQQGVYPLPEAQLDRFLFKQVVEYPSLEEETAIVARHGGRFGAPQIEEWGIEAVADPATLDAASATVANIRFVDDVVTYVVRLVRATRESASLETGASPRAAAMLASAARARAALDGRDYAIPDDVKALALPLLRHRVILSPAAQIDGKRVETVVAELIAQTEAPAMIYPSGRAAILVAAGAIPALAVALAVPQYWYAGLVFVVLILALTIADALGTPGARSLEVALDAPAAAFVGQEVQLDITASVGGTSRFEAIVEHDARLAEKEGNTSLSKTYTSVRRGSAALDALWLRWPGLFGLVWRQKRVALDRQIAILPDVRPARAEALRLFRRDASIGEIVQVDKGAGGEFQALAEFRSGMDRRTIDWKASARHGGLIAKEYRTERNNDIVFAIDSGRLMCEPVEGVPRIDRAISAALTAAFVALKLGDKVSLFGFDARPRISSGAVSGIGSFGTFQRLAADLDYSNEETNFTLALTTLGAQLKRRSLVLVFTDFVDPTSAELMLKTVGRLAERHLVLFVLMHDVELAALADADPVHADDVSRAVIAAAMLRERRIVVARLQRLGVHIVEASYDRLGPELVNAYLGLKRRNLL